MATRKLWKRGVDVIESEFHFIDLEPLLTSVIRYRVWYDGYTVTIICCPSVLHNMAAVTVVDSLVEEAVMVLRTAGISDDVISRIKKAGNETSASDSRTRSYREPDGTVLFEDRTSPRIHRIVLEVGFSQNYVPLQRATMWWLTVPMPQYGSLDRCRHGFV
jgi:hypothetical protein